MPNNLEPTMVRDVKFKNPLLHATYQDNETEQHLKECPPDVPGAAYSIEWEMSSYHARALRAELKAYYVSCYPNSPFTKVIGMKKMNNGNYEFRATRNGTNSQGGLNDKPRVIDGAKQPLADLAFLSGSKGSIKVYADPVTDKYGNDTIRLIIDTIQVVHAIYSRGPDIE